MSIVFLEDWKKYPTAIPDTKTRNKSWIELAKLYRSMGIKNYYFHLALIQPALQGVDPHSDNLTVEQKAMILWECDNNIWYFIREIILVKNAGITLEECMFKADRGQIAAIWLTLACIDYIRIQPRQTGKSFGANCITLWLVYFHYKDTVLNLITKDEKLRQSNVKSYKDIRDEWPDYVNRNTKKDDNNQVSISCNMLNNKLFTHVAQNSEKSANNLGRGLTSPYLQFDEAPFISFIEKTMVGALGSTGAARRMAKARGKVFCNVFTTTAGDKDDRDGKVIYKMWCEAAPWNELFLDAIDRDALISLIKTNQTGRAVTVNLTMNHRQLGLDDEWLEDKLATARGEGDDADKDYMNLWTGGSQASILPRHLAEALRNSEMSPIENELSKEGYIFKWYEKYDPNESYTLSVDTSDAIGRDDIAVPLIKNSDGGVAGTACFNTTYLPEFAEWLVQFMVKYKRFTMIIERRHNAQVIIDYVILGLIAHGEDPFRRMFNHIVQNKDTRQKDFALINSSSHNRPKHITEMFRTEFGFVTGSENRKDLYRTIMVNAIKDAGSKVRDSTIIQQILGLVVKNDRIDHSSSGHDDMVIAYLIGHWFLNRGVNLSFYGIDFNRILIDRDKDGKELTLEQKVEQDQQKQIASEIESVYEMLKEARSQFDIFRLEAKLQALMLRVDTVETNVRSFDALVEEANRVRRNRIRLRR